MGAVVGESWTDDEAACFEKGLSLYGKQYKVICKQLMPHREPKDLALYYYNVWKIQATPCAQAWCKKRQALKGGAQLVGTVLHRWWPRHKKWYKAEVMKYYGCVGKHAHCHRLFYEATNEDETVVLRGVMWYIRLEGAQQAAEPLSGLDPATGYHDDPEQVAGPLSGPQKAAGLLLDMPSRAPASTAQVVKARPRAVGAPLQAPAPPAHALVTPPPPEAATSTHTFDAQKLQRPCSASPPEVALPQLATPPYQAGSQCMAGDMLEGSEFHESAEQLEAHPRSSGADVAAATPGDRSQLLEVQQGSAAVVEVAAVPEPGRCPIPDLRDGIRALKALDECARQNLQGPYQASPPDVPVFAPPPYQGGSVCMAVNLPEVSAPEESGDQLEAHPRAWSGDAAAAAAISGGASAATAGDTSQLLEVQQGSAVVQVAAASEPGRRRRPNLHDGIRALKVLDESARQVCQALNLPQPWLAETNRQVVAAQLACTSDPIDREILSSFQQWLSGDTTGHGTQA